MNIFSFLWDNKISLALAAVIIAAALVITALYVENSVRGVKIEKLAAQNEKLDAENKILKQNAAAIQQAVREMKELAGAAEELRKLMRALPADFRESLKNEQMDRLNYCLGAFFRDGVLPGECGDTAVLPGAR